MTVGVKIFDGKEKVGLVSIDITLREMNQHLEKISANEEASIFIITEKGEFWGNSEVLYLNLNVIILNLENEELKKLGTIVLNKNNLDSVIINKNIYMFGHLLVIQI